MFRLDGKVAVITGASGGIGSAIARITHAQGAKTVLVGRNQQVLEQLTATWDKATYCCFAVDLQQQMQAEQLIGEIEQTFAPIDILINNAGLTKDRLLMSMRNADWDSVLQVNLTSSFALMRTAIRGMLKRRQGRIISIVSVVATTGNPGQANYAASKAGLIGLSKSLAREVASRGITVNCIAPGFIASPMTAKLNQKQTEAILASIPQGRMGEADDIAQAVTYLASDAGKYITGQTLHINGGMLMA